MLNWLFLLLKYINLKENNILSYFTFRICIQGHNQNKTFSSFDRNLFLLVLNHNKIFFAVVRCCLNLLLNRPWRDCQQVGMNEFLTWKFSRPSTDWRSPLWTWHVSCYTPGSRTCGRSLILLGSLNPALARWSPVEEKIIWFCVPFQLTSASS